MCVRLSEVPVAILAGGKATRLGPLAAHLPEALIPVASRPFVDHRFNLLSQHGARRVVFCVGHFGE